MVDSASVTELQLFVWLVAVDSWYLHAHPNKMSPEGAAYNTHQYDYHYIVIAAVVAVVAATVAVVTSFLFRNWTVRF